MLEKRWQGEGGGGGSCVVALDKYNYSELPGMRRSKPPRDARKREGVGQQTTEEHGLRSEILLHSGTKRSEQES